MSDDDPYTVPYIIKLYGCSRDADSPIICLMSLRALSTSDGFFIIIYVPVVINSDIHIQVEAAGGVQGLHGPTRRRRVPAPALVRHAVPPAVPAFLRAGDGHAGAVVIRRVRVLWEAVEPEERADDRGAGAHAYRVRPWPPLPPP